MIRQVLEERCLYAQPYRLLQMTRCFQVIMTRRVGSKARRSMKLDKYL